MDDYITEKYNKILNDNPSEENRLKAIDDMNSEKTHAQNLKIFLCKEFYYRLNGYKQIDDSLISYDNLPSFSISNEMLKLCKDVISSQSTGNPPPPAAAPKIINNKNLIEHLIISSATNIRDRSQSNSKIKKNIKAINENWSEIDNPPDIHYLDPSEQIEWIMYHTNKDKIKGISGIDDSIVTKFNEMFKDSQFTSLKEYCNECVKQEGGCKLNNEGLSICIEWEEK